MISCIPGRRILTTTSSPPSRVAACTCAMEAAASAVRSKLEKISASPAPKASSTAAAATSPGKGGTRS